jgi:hypothetical protein
MSNERAGELGALKEIVVAHRIHFEVLPEEWGGREVHLKVGFELKLWGAHLRGAAATPGCDKCRYIFDDLRRIAAWITPTEERASRYEIEMFDRALYASPSIKDTDEVGLTLKILHRDRGDLPVDTCEEHCLADMRLKLRDLGVPEGSWRSMSGATAGR